MKNQLKVMSKLMTETFPILEHDFYGHEWWHSLATIKLRPRIWKEKEGYTYDPDDPWNGLFRSSILVLVCANK
jgi:hypothetical protein